MTFEQALAKLDEIAKEVATIGQCSICRRSYLRNELSEFGSRGSRVCAKCGGLLASTSAISIPAQTEAA